MDNLVDLSELKQMDYVEVETIRGLVVGLFGAFDSHVEIEGVYFGERRYPHTVYLSKNNRFNLAICLPQHQAHEPLARLLHLSHELVHCLNPNGPPPQATILKEGLAEHSKIYLSRDFYQDEYPDYDFRNLSSKKYLVAFNKIEEIIEYEGLEGMRNGIRTIRDMTGLPFCQITEDDLARYFIRTPRTLLEELSQPFRD